MDGIYKDLKLEVTAGIFCIKEGRAKILLERRLDDPYKGYWQLPGKIMEDLKTAEDEIYDAVHEKCGISNIYLEQAGTYTGLTRREDVRLITINFMGLVSYSYIRFKLAEREEYETSWFDIDQIPKLAYDNEEIINKVVMRFKESILRPNLIKKLYPSDFTLPEIQRMLEHIYNLKIDRRNFRKKVISHNIVEDTLITSEGTAGRPAKLYTFKDDANLTKLL